MFMKTVKGEKKLSFLYVINKEEHTSSCKDFILEILKCHIIIAVQ